jgi:hypothetical protein
MYTHGKLYVLLKPLDVRRYDAVVLLTEIYVTFQSVMPSLIVVILFKVKYKPKGL